MTDWRDWSRCLGLLLLGCTCVMFAQAIAIGSMNWLLASLGCSLTALVLVVLGGHP